MEIRDKKEFAILMGEMAIAFRTEVNRETLQVYFSRLQECTMYQVRLAITEITDKDEYFPKLSRIKTLAKAQRREPSRHASDALQIEEQTFSNDLPRTKEEFFAAMKDLTGDLVDHVTMPGEEDNDVPEKSPR